MPEFFPGWKRKVGVITLLVACFSVGAWVRSESAADQFVFYGWHTRISRIMPQSRLLVRRYGYVRKRIVRLRYSTCSAIVLAFTLVGSGYPI